MKREEIKERVFNALSICQTANGELFTDIFGQAELHNIANTITHHFPENSEYKLTHLDAEIFDKIPDKEDALRSWLKESMWEVVKGNEEHLYQIFFLSGYFLFMNKNEDIDNLFDKMINYYNSFKMDLYSLKQEIKDNPVEGAEVRYIDNETVIRFKEEGFKNLQLLSSALTREQFKELMIWK